MEILLFLGVPILRHFRVSRYQELTVFAIALIQMKWLIMSRFNWVYTVCPVKSLNCQYDIAWPKHFMKFWRHEICHLHFLC